MNPKLLNVVALAGLVLVGLLFGRYAVPAADAGLALELSAQRHAADSLRGVAERESTRADSLAAHARTRIDTARVVLTRWRTLRDTLRLTDTLAVPVLVAEADRLALACEFALTGCEDAIAAKDSALAAERGRAEALAGYRTELEERIVRMERTRGRRDALFGVGGLATGLLACSVAR